MSFPVVKGASYSLIHSPNFLLTQGTTQTQEMISNPNSEYLKELPTKLRSFQDAVKYPPNQAYIGGIHPNELRDIPRPHFENGLEDAETFAKFGEIMPEDVFYGVIKICDSFDLVHLTETFAQSVKEKIANHPVLQKLDTAKLDKFASDEEIAKAIERHGEKLVLDGVLVGAVSEAHATDKVLTSHVILENLVAKASAVVAMLHLEKNTGINLSEVDYVIETSEEACGDMNQRGGGNFAKAIAEVAGCVNANGADIRGFCAAPAHGVLNASALVKAGIFKNVVVVAGGSTAKLGMNGKEHVAKGMPVLEDMIGTFALLISENDGESPVIRTDIIGRHKIGTGSSPQAVTSALVTEALEAHGLTVKDVDRFSVEMQNPELTEPAGAGNVPEANYKMIAALGVKRGDLEKKDLLTFVKDHGMPGFAPTQGHIPSGVPYVGHGMDEMKEGKINRAMIIGKGSLFLGRMTNQFDGVSFVMEANNGQGMTSSEDNSAAINKKLAQALREVAEKFDTEE